MRTLSSLLPLVMSLAICVGCEAEDDDPGLLQVSDDAAVDDAGVDADPFGFRADFGPVNPGGSDRFIGIFDISQGVNLGGGLFGADVDAVTFRCPDGRSGFGEEVAVDARRAPGDAHPAAAAVGPPDGPCDPISDCAAPLGVGGALLLRVQSGALDGCSITVYELPDRREEEFEVWICDQPDIETCVGPWFRGGDGEATVGEIPQ